MPVVRLFQAGQQKRSLNVARCYSDMEFKICAFKEILVSLGFVRHCSAGWGLPLSQLRILWQLLSCSFCMWWLLSDGLGLSVQTNAADTLGDAS